MKSAEQKFDFPAATITPQYAVSFCDLIATVPAVRGNQRQTELIVHSWVERVTVVNPISDSSIGRFTDELPLDGRHFDEDGFI